MTRPPVNRRLDVPGQSPAEDRLLAMVAALTSEVAVLCERLDTVARLAGVQGAVEEYVPDEAAVKDRDSHRQRLIAKVFRPLKDDAERALTKETGA